MSKEIMQESTQIVECNAFHRGMSVLEANLRNTEDSESTISVLLKGAAEFYGASRASVVSGVRACRGHQEVFAHKMRAA